MSSPLTITSFGVSSDHPFLRGFPEFDFNTTKYTLPSQYHQIDEITVAAEAADDSTTLTWSGSDSNASKEGSQRALTSGNTTSIQLRYAEADGGTNKTFIWNVPRDGSMAYEIGRDITALGTAYSVSSYTFANLTTPTNGLKGRIVPYECMHGDPALIMANRTPNSVPNAAEYMIQSCVLDIRMDMNATDATDRTRIETFFQYQWPNIAAASDWQPWAPSHLPWNSRAFTAGDGFIEWTPLLISERPYTEPYLIGVDWQ